MGSLLRFKSPVFIDSFRNFLTGLGVLGVDKNESTYWAFSDLDVVELEAAYRCDWLARKIIEIPAYDCTRAWRQWFGTKEQIAALEETEKAFGLQRKLLSALEKSRLYGGAAMVLGVDSGTFQQELNLDEVKKGDLKFIHVVSRHMIAAGPRVLEITSPWFGEPTYYTRSNSITIAPPGGVEPIGEPTMGQKPGDMLYIHPSRVVRLVGSEYPDMERSPDPWGDSVLLPVQDAVKRAGIVQAALTSIIHEAKLDIIKVPGLTAKFQTDVGTEAILKRFSQANIGKSVVKALLLDKDEEWERNHITLSSWDNVMNAFFLVCCAAADIPATRFMGREPSGMNSSGDSDTRNYYDRLAADQVVKYTPALSRLDEVLIRHTFGSRDPDIKYEWNPLYQMSDADKAESELKAAQAFKIDVDSGIISPHVLQEGRQSHLISSGWLYPGMQTAIEDEAEWDAEEGVSEARTGGMKDPNDPDVVGQKTKAVAENMPKDPDPGGESGKSSRGGNDEP
jgi:hypothetical protein